MIGMATQTKEICQLKGEKKTKQDPQQTAGEAIG